MLHVETMQRTWRVVGAFPDTKLPWSRTRPPLVIPRGHVPEPVPLRRTRDAVTTTDKILVVAFLVFLVAFAIVGLYFGVR